MDNSEIKIEDLQLAELKILKEFINVCKKLNLKYFLDSGTLLGCIRHKGFIPWDDDIDVSMPREDYNIFIKEGQKLLNGNYFIQNYNTEPEFTMNFSKIRNTNTTFIESSVKNLKINHGVYIDIFPLDGYNPREKIRNILNEKKIVLYNIQIAKKYNNYIRPTKTKQKVLEKISDIIYGRSQIKQLLVKKDKIAQKHKYIESKYVCCYSYNNIKPKMSYIPKDYLGNGTVKMFERIPTIVPVKYDMCLKRMYGDYRKLPPKEERIPHHYNEIIDLNKSYKEYVKREEKICKD